MPMGTLGSMDVIAGEDVDVDGLRRLCIVSAEVND